MSRFLGKRLVLGVGAAALLAACGGGDLPDSADMSGASSSEPGARVTLTGAGATFPYPIYSRWFSIYSQNNPVRVNYQSIGSGGGIRQMIEGTVDFGASDAPLTEEDLAQIPGTLSIPTVLGAVVITYNLPELSAPLRIDGETIAAMFLGEITRWNDPRLQALNPGIQLPDMDVIAAHRSDGSGTTYVFTDYLATVSPVWLSRVGRGNAVRWPTGLGARGNEGVTGQVRQTPGAVGYVEQAFARQNNLPMASVRNSSDAFISPSIEATTAAAEGLEGRIPDDDDFRISIVDPDTPGGYPISSWTYLLIAPHYQDCAKAEALTTLIEWVLLEGEDDAVALWYAPLPMPLRYRALNALKSVTCGSDNRPVIDPSRTFGAEFTDVGTGARPG